MKYKIVEIDIKTIYDWDSFHDVFSETFGFPNYYGRNMNAWIDLMSYLNDDANDCEFNLEKSEMLVMQIRGVKNFKQNFRELYNSLVECSSFVNSRNIEIGADPVIILSFD